MILPVSDAVFSITANEKALKKWGIRSTHFHKPIQMIRSTTVQVTDNRPISFNAVLSAAAFHYTSFKALNLFCFKYFLAGIFSLCSHSEIQ